MIKKKPRFDLIEELKVVKNNDVVVLKINTNNNPALMSQLQEDIKALDFGSNRVFDFLLLPEHVVSINVNDIKTLELAISSYNDAIKEMENLIKIIKRNKKSK